MLIQSREPATNHSQDTRPEPEVRQDTTKRGPHRKMDCRRVQAPASPLYQYTRKNARCQADRQGFVTKLSVRSAIKTQKSRA